MIRLKKMCALTTKNFRNLGAHQIIEIVLVLRNLHMVFRDKDKFVFYINNCIYQNQFNQLYNSNWLEKNVQNVVAVSRKLRPALKRASNYRLEVAKKKRQKKEKIVEKRKIKTITKKYCRGRREISLSSKEKKNDKSDTRDDRNLDQTNDKYPANTKSVQDEI